MHQFWLQDCMKDQGKKTLPSNNTIILKETGYLYIYVLQRAKRNRYLHVFFDWLIYKVILKWYATPVTMNLISNF